MILCKISLYLLIKKVNYVIWKEKTKDMIYLCIMFVQSLARFQFIYVILSNVQKKVWRVRIVHCDDKMDDVIGKDISITIFKYNLT